MLSRVSRLPVSLRWRWTHRASFACAKAMPPRRSAIEQVLIARDSRRPCPVPEWVCALPSTAMTRRPAGAVATRCRSAR
ncbi:hypothetical protein AQJ43_28945 [Streptomyces avermitilis]|nr:hypothetical protein AQJ43_28945 [Streptomyces avermitilis]